MTSLGWEIPSFNDFLIFLFLGILPVVFLTSFFTHLCMRHFFYKGIKWKTIGISSFATPLILLISLMILNLNQITFNNIISMIYQINVFLIYYFIFVILSFILLIMIDKLFILPVIQMSFFIFIFTIFTIILYPKNIYKEEYQSDGSLNIIRCDCIGKKSRNDSESHYNVCIGLLKNCNTTKVECESNGNCPIML